MGDSPCYETKNESSSYLQVINNFTRCIRIVLCFVFSFSRQDLTLYPRLELERII